MKHIRTITISLLLPFLFACQLASPTTPDPSPTLDPSPTAGSRALVDNLYSQGWEQDGQTEAIISIARCDSHGDDV